MKKYLFLVLVFILDSMHCYASSEALFSLVANTPTSVIVPANRATYIQYTVTNNTAITRRLTIKPIPYVVQVTDSNSCAKYFTLAQGQSCALTFVVKGSAIKSKFSGGPVVCKTKYKGNEPDSLLCSQPEPSMALSLTPAPAVPTTNSKLYVSNWGANTISLCYLKGKQIAHCLVSGLSKSFNQPEALAVSGNVLFVANIGAGMSSCAINSVTGELSDCKAAATASEPIYAPDGIAFDGSTAYISSSGPESFHQGVTTCTVSGSMLTACSFTQGAATFSVPSDLAIANGTVYVTNFNSQTVQTTYCTIGNACAAGTEGTITGTGNLLNEPEGLMFAKLDGATYAYFTNHGNNSVVVCTVLSATNFTNCRVTGGSFSGFGNLAVLTTPATAFIPSGLKTLSSCDVDPSNGSLSNCVNINNLGFNNPSGLLIL